MPWRKEKYTTLLVGEKYCNMLESAYGMIDLWRRKEVVYTLLWLSVNLFQSIVYEWDALMISLVMNHTMQSLNYFIRRTKTTRMVCTLPRLFGTPTMMFWWLEIRVLLLNSHTTRTKWLLYHRCLLPFLRCTKWCLSVTDHLHGRSFSYFVDLSYNIDQIKSQEFSFFIKESVDCARWKLSPFTIIALYQLISRALTYATPWFYNLDTVSNLNFVLVLLRMKTFVALPRLFQYIGLICLV